MTQWQNGSTWVAQAMKASLYVSSRTPRNLGPVTPCSTP